MPSPGLTRRRLGAFGRLEELERTRFVKEGLGEVRLAIVLRHAKNEMRNIGARMLQQILLGFLA